MSCDVGESTEGMENELFTYVTAHSPTLPSFYLHHNSFYNPSIASPMSQLILQPFFRFSYVTGFSLTSPGEPPMNTGQDNQIRDEDFFLPHCEYICRYYLHGHFNTEDSCDL